MHRLGIHRAVLGLVTVIVVIWIIAAVAFSRL
jgi:hypothetical protein